ncbi:MAG: thioredoxin [Candidatus Cloacimonetes bacterium]|nr:thioredoxin [Candidatus Cloacimonadota bacterium]
MKKLTIIIALGLLLGLTACGASDDNEAVEAATAEVHEGNYTVLTAAAFDDFIAEGRTVVDFWAPWCPPCRQLAPIFIELSHEIEGVRFGKLDTDDHPSIPQRYRITGIPTLIVFEDGVEVDRVVGLQGKEELKRVIAGN